MRDRLPLSAARHAVTSFTSRLAAKTLQPMIVVLSLFACTYFGIEGGYQLHLSYDHPALRCLEDALAASAGKQIDGPASLIAAQPPCREPDEVGQSWRRKLVLGDMLEFLIFGMLCIRESDLLPVADGPGRV